MALQEPAQVDSHGSRRSTTPPPPRQADSGNDTGPGSGPSRSPRHRASGVPERPSPLVGTRPDRQGMGQAEAFSRADIDVRRRAEVEVPAIERFAAGDPQIVATVAGRRLDAARRLARGSRRDRLHALRDLRQWGVLHTTIKAADDRHRARAARQAAAFSLGDQQRAIVRDVVPRWDWRHGNRLAPGLRGLVETNRNGAIHVWTMFALRPLNGDGGRFLDRLPPDGAVRVFDVSKGSLMEAMLLREGVPSFPVRLARPSGRQARLRLLMDLDVSLRVASRHWPAHDCPWCRGPQAPRSRMASCSPRSAHLHGYLAFPMFPASRTRSLLGGELDETRLPARPWKCKTID